MPSWSLIIQVSLLLSTVLVEARFRAHSKRRYSVSTPSLIENLQLDESNNLNNDQSWLESDKEATTTTATSDIDGKNSKPVTSGKYQANELQVEQFTRLLFERLNLKEPPNVTVNVSEGVGFPSSIVKQLEQQYLQQKEDENSHRQQALHDEIMPTAERAILPGNHILHHTCQRQLAAKLNLADEQLDNIDCFRFAKSSKETNSLPSNQVINELRIYMRKNYFYLNDVKEKLSPEMFRIYQVFRPTSNDTTHVPPFSLTGTMRIMISQVRQLNDHWFELVIEPDQPGIDLQQLYRQIIMPWFGLAIDRNLQHPSSTSSSMEQLFPLADRHLHRQFQSKKQFSFSSTSKTEDETEDESDQQLPYMLVEYGKKISPLSNGNRGTRSVAARPARGCHPSSPCCRRSLTIDLDQGSNALNFVIYPRQLDIGECVGLCGISGSSLKYTEIKNAQHRNEPNSAYNLLLLQNGLHFNRSSTSTQVNRPDQHSTQCCSYSRTGGLELMYTTTNGGPIIRKFIPNMVVEECKCGLPATIQQV